MSAKQCKHLFTTGGTVCLYCGEHKPDQLEARIREIVREEIANARKPHFITPPMPQPKRKIEVKDRSAEFTSFDQRRECDCGLCRSFR